jgi:hypothetical protein
MEMVVRPLPVKRYSARLLTEVGICTVWRA